VLKGSRQVGKTTILQNIHKYIDSNKLGNVVYLSADDLSQSNLFSDPEVLINYIKQTTSFPDNFTFLIIDEFQVIDQAGIFLKNIFDKYSNQLQLIVSGSSSLDITKNLEFLTGRSIEFNIDRVSFREYFKYLHQPKSSVFSLNQFEDAKLWYKTMENKIDNAFESYLIYGGYPEVLIEKNLENKKVLLKSIIQTYIEKDIIHFLKIENINAFNNLLKLMASQSGNLVNSAEVRKTLGISINTLKKYLEITEGTFVFKFLKPFSTNLRTEMTKMPKVYCLDPGIRSFLLDSWSTEFAISGHNIENFVYLNLKSQFEENKIHFYRTISGAEIDFIIEKQESQILPIEVKYKTIESSNLPLSIKNLQNRYENRTQPPIIMTKNQFECSENLIQIPVKMLPFISL